MGNNLRIAHDHMGLRVTPTVTSEAAGFEAKNGLDGNRQSFVKSTATGTWDWIYDAGVGKTETADTLVLARADLLAGVTATVEVAYSDDAVAYTVEFTEAITTGILKKPANQDYYREFTNRAKRAWRVRLTLGTAVYQFAELFLGARAEVTKNPRYPLQVGLARPHMGADLQLEFGQLGEAQLNTLLNYLTDVSPGFPAEAPMETAAGAVYGGRPHWVYDPTGNLFRQTAPAAAALVHVLLMNPGDAIGGLTFKGLHDLPPLRYRQLV